jgi:hypothetical protein
MYGADLHMVFKKHANYEWQDVYSWWFLMYYIAQKPRLLNRKMTKSEVTEMVPELEIDKKYQTISVSTKKCCGTPILHMHYDRYKMDTGSYWEAASILNR